MTAVQGKQPTKVPSIQSARATLQTPQATLIPDQGTTPTRRRKERRTHGDFGRDWLSLPWISPDRATRVMSIAPGEICIRNGANGFESKVAQAEPRVVRVASKTVAGRGENNAPARTF